jgi:hypothetical protein
LVADEWLVDEVISAAKNSEMNSPAKQVFEKKKTIDPCKSIYCLFTLIVQNELLMAIELLNNLAVHGMFWFVHRKDLTRM